MTRHPLSIALLIALLFPGCSSEKTLPGSGQSEQTEQTSTDTGSVDDASDTTDTTDSGSPDEGAQAHSLEAALLPAVTKAIEAGMPGVIVYARVGEEEISIAQGKADIEADVPMRPDHMFRIASNSKTYLATVAAQLHSAGTFSLDTPIQDILSGDEIDAIENADVVVIVTEWDQFRALDLDRVKTLVSAPKVVDLRNIYKPDYMEARGFEYTSVGRSY